MLFIQHSSTPAFQILVNLILHLTKIHSKTKMLLLHPNVNLRHAHAHVHHGRYGHCFGTAHAYRMFRQELAARKIAEILFSIGFLQHD